MTNDEFLSQERLIHAVIHRHFAWVHTCRVEYDDMVQQGWIGLHHARDTYQAEKGAWSTYAYFKIRYAIQVTVNTQITPLSTKSGCFTNGMDRMSESRLEHLHAAKHCVSTSATIKTSRSLRKTTVGDLVKDQHDHIAEYDDQDETTHLYELCRACLRPRELQILTQLADGVPASQIAKSEGVSTQRIHQIRLRGIARVREMMRRLENAK